MADEKKGIAELEKIIEENERLKARVQELEEFRDKAFQAYPNIDLDIEALIEE